MATSHDSVLISVSFHTGHIGAKRNLLPSINLNDQTQSQVKSKGFKLKRTLMLVHEVNDH
jgi:hypothetical protein